MPRIKCKRYSVIIKEDICLELYQREFIVDLHELVRSRLQARQCSERINSPIHKAGGFTVHGHSTGLPGIIPVEQKSVHWLSMGAAGRNDLLSGRPYGGFVNSAANDC